MDSKLKYYLSDLVSDENPSDELVKEVQSQLDFQLPSDYVEVIKHYNGGEGEIGENSWLCLFGIEELINTNKDYHLLMDDIPEYFLFAKDSADTGFAFHKEKKTIHSFGLMSDFKTDAIKFCGNSFLEFIEYLYNRS
jgi:hypothetical protein